MAKQRDLQTTISDYAIGGTTFQIAEMFSAATTPHEKAAIAFALTEATVDIMTHRERGMDDETLAFQLGMVNRLFESCGRPVLRDAVVAGFCAGTARVLQFESPAVRFEAIVEFALNPQNHAPMMLAGQLRDTVRPIIRIHSALSENPQDNPFVTNFNRLNLVAG